MDLAKALYSDEMSLVQVSRSRCFSIKGWFPAVEDYADFRQHLTVILVFIPEIGTIYALRFWKGR